MEYGFESSSYLWNSARQAQDFDSWKFPRQAQDFDSWKFPRGNLETSTRGSFHGKLETW